jgi:hypothetical protein
MLKMTVFQHPAERVAARSFGGIFSGISAGENGEL